MNMTQGGRSLAPDGTLVSIKIYILWEKCSRYDKYERFFSHCSVFTLYWGTYTVIDACECNGIERLLPNAHTLLGTTELITKMKPMSRMTLEGKVFKYDASRIE